MSVATLALGTAEGILLGNTANATSTNVSSAITGTGTVGLTIADGAGTVTLSSANTYTGVNALDSGTLVVGNNTALSNAALTLTGGALQTSLTAGLLLTNPINLNNANVTLGGGANNNPLLFAGPLGISLTNNVLNVANTSTTDFDGSYLYSAGFLTKTGTGTLTLSGGIAAYNSSLIFVNQGIVLAQNSNALGVGVTTANIPTTGGNTVIGGAIESGNTVTITTGLPHTFVAGEAVTIAGVTSASYNGTYTITSVLTPTSFTYFDPTTGLVGSTGQGTAVLAVPSAVVNPNAVVVANGASVQVLGNDLAFGARLILNGAGPTGNGALENLIGGGNTSQVTGLLGQTAGQGPYGVGSNTWAGNIYLASATVIGVDGGTTLTQDTNNIVGNSSLTKVGPGTLIGTNATGNNGFFGQTNINNGIVYAQNNTFLGLNTAPIVVNTGAASPTQFLNFSGNPTGGTFTLSFNGAPTNPITYSTTFSVLQANIIAALTALPAVGAGNVTVSTNTTGVVVTFLGSVAALSQINLTVSATALTGGTAPSLVVTTYGGTFETQSSIYGKQLVLNGLGFGNVGAYPMGALSFFNGSVDYAGKITLNPGTAIGGASGLTDAITGVISGADLTKTGNGTFDLMLLAANTFTGNVTVDGGTLTMANTNSYSGATTINMASSASTVNGGALDLELLGAAPNTSSITVNGSGWFQRQVNISVLQLDNTHLVSSTRLSSTTPILLNGGLLNFVAANAAIATTQAVGPVTLGSGQSTIAAGFDFATPVQAAPGAVSQLTLASLSRNPGGTVDFLGGSTAPISQYSSGFGFNTAFISPLGTAKNQLLITQISGVAPAAAMVGSSTVAGHIGEGILPWGEINGAAGTGGFVTYNGASGVGINAFQGYVTSIAAAGPGDTVLETNNGSNPAGETILAGKTINALLMYSYAGLQVTLNPNVTLTLTSGAIMGAGTLGQLTIGNGFNGGNPQGTLNFGTTEGIVFNNCSNSNWNIDTFISGTAGVSLGGGLTQSGNGTTWNINGSTYSGGTYINADYFLGSSSNNIFGLGPGTFNGGEWLPNYNPVVISNPVNLNGLYNFTNDPTTFTGPITLTANAILSASNTVYFNGPVGESGGSHSLTIANSGLISNGTGGSSIFLNNINTYSGGTIVSSSSTPLIVGNAGALGSGLLSLDSGVFDASVAVTLPNPVLLGNLAATNFNSSLYMTINAGQLGTNGSIVQGNNLTFGGPTILVGNNTLLLSNNGYTSFAGGIIGSGALGLTGTGVALLPTANTFTGGLTVLGMPTAAVTDGNVATPGTVLLGNPNAAGSGTLILAGGVLTTTGAMTIPNNLILGSVTTVGTNPITFSGTATLIGPSTITAGNTAGTIFSGVIGEGGGPLGLDRDRRQLAVADRRQLLLRRLQPEPGRFRHHRRHVQLQLRRHQRCDRGRPGLVLEPHFHARRSFHPLWQQPCSDRRHRRQLLHRQQRQRLDRQHRSRDHPTRPPGHPAGQRVPRRRRRLVDRLPPYRHRRRL